MIKQTLEKNFPHLKDLRVREILIDKNTKKISCTLSYPDANNKLDMPTRRALFDAVKSCVPQGYFCTTTIKNDVFNVISFRQFVKDTIVSKFLAMADIDKENIIVTMPESDKRFFQLTLLLNDVQMRTAEASSFVTKFKQYLNTYSCYDCNITLEISDKHIDLKSVVEAQQKLADMAIARELLRPVRRFEIEEVSRYIGKLVTSSPMYIMDIKEPRNSCTVCGVISKKSMKNTKNVTLGLVKFNLKDKSADMDCVCFLRYRPQDSQMIAEATGKGEAECKSIAEKNQAYNEKIRKLWLELYDGTEVVVEGKVVKSQFSGNLELQVHNLSKCRISDKQKGAQLRAVPQQYVTIFPKECQTYRQLTFADKDSSQVNLFWKYDTVTCTFVVTGNNVLTDKLLAVCFTKIKQGRVVEQLYTNINPETDVDSNLLLMINQTAKQLLYSPTLAEVLGDIMKFTHNCVIVGQQLEVLKDFLNYYGTPIGYVFNNELRNFGDVVTQINNKSGVLVGTPNTNVVEEVAKACGLKHLPSATVQDKSMLMAQCICKIALV